MIPSWDEMAKYDVPSSIDYILATTGREDLYYVGWSMGTTVFWAMMDERPEYNSKVCVCVCVHTCVSLDGRQGMG